MANVGKNEKQETLRGMIKFFLTHRDVRISWIAKELNITERTAFRYWEELKLASKLRDGRLQGMYEYVPDADDIEMSVLMLNRALEENVITEEMIAVAKLILQHDRASV